MHGQATPPDAVNGVSVTATDIAAGVTHSCAIQAGTGDVVCWGYDYYGQATPPSGVTATDIAAGFHHTLAVPEPSRWLLLAAGLGCLVALCRICGR